MKQKGVYRWLLTRIRKRLPALIVLCVCSVAVSVLDVFYSLGYRDVIDGAVSGQWETFWKACLMQGIIIVGLLAIHLSSKFLTERLRMDLDRDWKRELYHGLLHGDYAGISAYHSGELLNRMNNDVRILNTAILANVPNVFSMITKIIAAAAALIVMEPMVTVILVAGGGILLVVTTLIRRSLKNLNKRVSEEEGKVSGFLQESMEKLLMIQAMDVSEEMEQRAESVMESRYQVQRKRKNVSQLSASFMNIFAYGTSFGTLLFCANGLLHRTMSYGTLTAMTQLVSQVRTPMMNMSGIVPQHIAMVAAAERLMELEALYSQQEPQQRDPEPLYAQMQSITARALCFAYDRDQVFADARFSVKKGEFGVILGHSGIGKSTLLKLLLGIYKPASGGLYVCDSQGGEIPLDRSTRRLFAYVPQGNLLISGTLRENLILTRPDATEEQIRRAVHISCMDDYLPSLPKGLDTQIGESAAGLSEGQAQRLSIARAILSDAPVLLLDEATSALDADTEKLVLERLRGLPGKTCIAVTHRPAAIALSDWTMEMRDGKCVVTRTEK